MSATIYWPPSTDNDPASYDIQRSTVQEFTSPVDVANVLHDFAGANYDNGRFFYVDAAGSASSWYRVRTVDSIGQLGAWSSPFQAQMENAIPRVLITGRVLLPDGSAPTSYTDASGNVYSGTVTAKLSQPGSVLDGTVSQRVAMEVTGQLEADGAMPEGFRLVPNDIITPTGTAYLVKFQARSGSGPWITWTEKWQLASSPDPIDVGAVPRLNVVPGVAVAPPIPGPAGPQGATGPAGSPGFGGVADVMTLGAVGDGATDDSAAFTAAKNTGKPVFLPAGSYYVPSFVLDRAKMVLLGAGQNLSKIVSPLALGNCLVVSAADITVQDLEIDGRYASQPGVGTESTGVGILLQAGASRFTARRLWIHDTAGNGISNPGQPDMLVDGCRIANGGVAASQVQAVPAPTTTAFAVGPGTSKYFAAGQSLRIGAQTGTVASVQSVASVVATPTSTSVFDVGAGDGAKFSGGQVIHIGGQTGTIQSIATDTITLTAPLGTAPVAGQIVAIDNITLTAPITAPTAGQTVAVTGGYLKGIYVSLAAERPVIRNNRFTGWSQAIGLWYGVRKAIIANNVLFANFGYEDSAHTTNRSALELYPANAAGGDNVITGNVVEGSTHNGIEVAQGEAGSRIVDNVVSMWASESGLGSTGVGLEITGQSGTPGGTKDITVSGNLFRSAGVADSFGVSINSYTAGIGISANTFVGFATSGSIAIVHQGGDGPLLSDNIMRSCVGGIFVNNSSGTPGTISGNVSTDLPRPYNSYGVTLSAAVDGWTISGNVFSTLAGASGAGAGIKILSGNRHKVIGNSCTSQTPFQIQTNENTVLGNYAFKIVNDAQGAIRILGAAARNVVALNTSAMSVSGYGVSIEGTADYNHVFENTLLTSVPYTISSSGTHNIVDGNLSSATTYTISGRSLGSQTVGTTQATIAHGLDHAPTEVRITMSSAGTIWRSAASDATNIYLTADSAGRTADIWVR